MSCSRYEASAYATQHTREAESARPCVIDSVMKGGIPALVAAINNLVPYK